MSVIPYNNRKKYLEIDRDGGVMNFSQVKSFIGDRRDAAAVPFTNGRPTTTKELDGKGSGDITLSSPANNQIQIAGSSENPNFITLGYVPGDIVIVRYDDKTIEQLTVSSVSSTILTFTTNLTGTVGGTSSASENSSISLKPNVTITVSEIHNETAKNFQALSYKGYFISGDFFPETTMTTTLKLQNCTAVLTSGQQWSFEGGPFFLYFTDIILYGQNAGNTLMVSGSVMGGEVTRLIAYGLTSDTSALQTRTAALVMEFTRCEAFSFTQTMFLCSSSLVRITSCYGRDTFSGVHGTGEGAATVNSCAFDDLRGGALTGIPSAAFISIRGYCINSNSNTATTSATAYGFHVSRGGKIHVFPNVAAIDVDTTLTATMNGVSKVLKGGAGVFDGDNMFSSTGGYITEG